MIGPIITLFFVVASFAGGFIVGMMFGNGGSNDVDVQTNNTNLQDLASFINQTSDDRNIVIVVNNLNPYQQLPPYSKELGYGYNITK